MSKFNKLYEEEVLNTMLPFEDYSLNISKDKTNKFYIYDNCQNNCLISEDSLSRTLTLMNQYDFAILTAYRGNYSKAENIIRNRQLRAKLNACQMGVHQLVGHWQEAPIGKEYEQCSPNELKDVVERSYLVIKSENISFEEFKNLILSLLTIDNETQDAAVIKNENGVFLLFNNGNMSKISDGVQLGKIGQAYSQHVKKMNVPFVFEGIEIPATNFAKIMYKNNNIKF